MQVEGGELPSGAVETLPRGVVDPQGVVSKAGAAESKAVAAESKAVAVKGGMALGAAQKSCPPGAPGFVAPPPPPPAAAAVGAAPPQRRALPALLGPPPACPALPPNPVAVTKGLANVLHAYKAKSFLSVGRKAGVSLYP